MKGHPPPDMAVQDGTSRLGKYLQELRSVYSDSLVDLVATCMAPMPTRRPHSVYALQKMLAPHEFVSEDLPPPPPPPQATNPWSERIKAFSKRLA